LSNYETRATIRYLFLTLPFVLAFFVWLLYPSLAGFVLLKALKYPAPGQSPPLIWSLLLMFFYTWYLFSAIGAGGLLAVAAWMSKQRPTPKITHAYPMVSFVVLAYNEEQNIPHCINTLFKCAIQYPGPSEIIFVDDGSTDNTFEIAWATINSKQRELANIRAKVVRHTANIGKVEALRTGVNKAMGEYVAIVDPDAFWDFTGLAELVDYMRATQAITTMLGPMRVCGVKALRQLNEKNLEPMLEMQKKTMKIDYNDRAKSATIAPAARRSLWLTLLLWYNSEPRFLGAVIDFIALLSIPVFFWSAPDRVLFVLNLALFLLLLLTVGVVQQALALKFAYNQYAYKRMLWYTKSYYILRLINIAAQFITRVE